MKASPIAMSAGMLVRATAARPELAEAALANEAIPGALLA